MTREGFVSVKERYWYDVCVKCTRIVSPRHSSCPKCGSTEFKGTIRNKDGTVIQKPLKAREMDDV